MLLSLGKGSCKRRLLEHWLEREREQESQVVALERERSQHIDEVGLHYRYIGVLIDEMRGQEISVPPAPFKDPPIRRHEIDYMLVPLGPTGGWGFASVSDWAWGPAQGQASF